MAGIDCWRLLGVSPGASAEEVKAAFARRAHDVHPDGGGTGDSLTMRLLVEARDEALQRVGQGRERARAAEPPPAAARPQPTAPERPAAGREPCHACGRTYPRSQLTYRRMGRGLGLKPRAKVLVCRLCASHTEVYDRLQRDRRLLVVTSVVSGAATLGLVAYMLLMH